MNAQQTQETNPAAACPTLSEGLERSAFDGLEESYMEMTRQIEAAAPTCHFRKMNIEDDGYGGCAPQWWECSVCGHTKAL
jgi:hypothetical protein